MFFFSHAENPPFLTERVHDRLHDSAIGHQECCWPSCGNCWIRRLVVEKRGDVGMGEILPCFGLFWGVAREVVAKGRKIANL